MSHWVLSVHLSGYGPNAVQSCCIQMEHSARTSLGSVLWSLKRFVLCHLHYHFPMTVPSQIKTTCVEMTQRTTRHSDIMDSYVGRSSIRARCVCVCACVTWQWKYHTPFHHLFIKPYMWCVKVRERTRARRWQNLVEALITSRCSHTLSRCFLYQDGVWALCSWGGKAVSL